VKEYYQQMLRRCLFLQRLVNDLLDLSKLQNIDFKIEMEEVNLPEILQDLLRSSRPLAKQKEIQVELSLDQDLFVITADYGRLRQMFLIILDNAMKFSPHFGKVELELSEIV
jgi:signal transduction histidine kinase